MVTRWQLDVRGKVQGVGFRPFVYRLAVDLGLKGWVRNAIAGVQIEVEGDPAVLAVFCQRLQVEFPPQAAIFAIATRTIPTVGERDFAILDSDTQHIEQQARVVLPDLATCPDCLRELFDPRDRRYRYPFTNCTNCGPRYSILRSLPYDRVRTTMGGFTMCAACRAEYDNPRDRRFHAEPIACPHCGPTLWWADATGNAIATQDEALLAAAAAIREGQIVAVKGLGGFHLMADARNAEVVMRLRDRKQRPHKPLALMYPSLAAVLQDCEVSEAERHLLLSPAAPILLLAKRASTRDAIPNNSLQASAAIAPENATLGVMLPHTPLHHLLLAALGFPVVATSGNRTSEPLCIENTEALQRLGGIADGFLLHDRPITRPVDDSIVRLMAGHPVLLRCGRGYAPMPCHAPPSSEQHDSWGRCGQ